MTTTPRPTRTQMAELQGRYDAAVTAAEERLDQITQLTEHRDELRTQMAKLLDERAQGDPEAKALAGCVAALDAYENRPRPNNGSGGYVIHAPRRIDATTLPIGRILLYLAHRYGIDLVPRPDPTPDTDPRFNDLLADLTHATERYRIDAR